MPPFNWVLQFNTYLKDAGARQHGEPPYGHAELSTLKTFAKRMDFDLEESVTRLQKAGMTGLNENLTVLEIAAGNNVSPQQVYLAMKPEKRAPRIGEPMPAQPLSGTGRRTLADLCGE